MVVLLLWRDGWESWVGGPFKMFWDFLLVIWVVFSMIGYLYEDGN